MGEFKYVLTQSGIITMVVSLNGHAQDMILFKINQLMVNKIIIRKIIRYDYFLSWAIYA
jgi:hypothetical protein